MNNQGTDRRDSRLLEEQERQAYAAEPDRWEDVLVWEPVSAWPVERDFNGADSQLEYERQIGKARRSYVETPQDDDEGRVWTPYLVCPDE